MERDVRKTDGGIEKDGSVLPEKELENNKKNLSSASSCTIRAVLMKSVEEGQKREMKCESG